MKKGMINSALIHEEQRSVVLFLWLFYLISISYDILFFYVIPHYTGQPNFDIFHEGLGIWFYLILLVLLPIAIYFLKKGKPNHVKYIFFFTYIFLSLVNEITIYFGSTREYQNGNVVEIFLVLFSPIFVNKRYFTLVCVGMIFKYSIVGLVLQNSDVIIPILLLCILFVVAFILLNRFRGYVKAISNAYDQQLENMVKGIITTLELKDPYTRGHSERVANYALILAKATKKFSSEELKSFNYACLLHDIGKVNIPDHILMKPSKLTKEEYEIIKTHPVVGAEVMKSVEGLSHGIDIIRYHHERWDGKGYPEGLKGESIPLFARITAIADAFDAMTSSRSYRKALPLYEAYTRIVEGKGTQFDPDLVELFKEIYPKWEEVYHNYPWGENSKIIHFKENSF